MYSDEGISGTNTARREGFNRMIGDALAGKIDLIVTKSVSRFARNTVDSLTTVRKLKEKGIEIYFEKENIYTLDSKGELLITIMSSLAQEESRSISENTTWGRRKQFADGKGSVAFSHFLGYDRGPDGGFVINEKEAETVRLIYDLFLAGKSAYWIAKELTRRGLKTPTGKDKWCASSIMSILTNEKYKGDLLLQKSYTADFLTHKSVRNDGQIPQYYVEGHHEAIIPPETFDFVQDEVEKRKKVKYFSGDPFSGRIRCGCCGGYYGLKVWHSNDKYRREIYRCNNKYKADVRCSSPGILPERIRQALVAAVNALVENKDELIANIHLVAETLCDCVELEQEQAALSEELAKIERLADRLISENSRTAIDQEEYNESYNSLLKRYEDTKAKYEQAVQAIEDRKVRRMQILRFAEELEKQEPIKEYDDNLWNSLVEYITVYGKDDILVTFRNGTEIQG